MVGVIYNRGYDNDEGKCSNKVPHFPVIEEKLWYDYQVVSIEYKSIQCKVSVVMPERLCVGLVSRHIKVRRKYNDCCPRKPVNEIRKNPFAG